jgi:hypothetical protein
MNGLRVAVVGRVRNQPDQVGQWDKSASGGTRGYIASLQFGDCLLFAGSTALAWVRDQILLAQLAAGLEVAVDQDREQELLDMADDYDVMAAFSSVPLETGRDCWDFSLFQFQVLQVVQEFNGSLPASITRLASAIEIATGERVPVNVRDYLLCSGEFRFNPQRARNGMLELDMVSAYILQRQYHEVPAGAATGAGDF